MEFILQFPTKSEIVIVGDKLTGDISTMQRQRLRLFPTDTEFKSVFEVITDVTSADTYGHSIEISAGTVVNIYNYEKNIGLHELYGFVCHSVIINYQQIHSEISNHGLKSDNNIFKPEIIIPLFEEIKNDIIEIMNKAYNRN